MTAVRDRPASARAPREPAERVVRRDLEGMRAVAVLGVVIYHLHPSWLPGGFAGVDVFFVLSGFFITGLLLREGRRSGRIDLIAFWGRRARRLLPAAGLVLVLTVAASYLLVTALDARRFAVDAAYATVFSVNWRYAAQGDSYLADPDPSPMTHFWSLGVEEQFYLVWPVALLLIALLVRRAALPRAVFGLAAVAAVASFAYALHLTTADQPYAYFATYSRVWQLALGAALAVAVGRLSRLPVALGPVLRWAGVGAVVGFYALAPLDVVYPGWIALVPTLGAAAVIAAGAGHRQPAREPVKRVMSSPPAQLLGRYSYGWYLWHWPPLVLLPLALGRPLSTVQLVGVAGLTLVAAVASYHWVEHPLRASDRLARRRGVPSLALGLVVVLIGGGTAVAANRAADYDLGHDLVASSSGELRPQPGAAATQKTQPSRDGCQLPKSSPSLALACRYAPDRGKGDVVMLGDSHSTQWFPAIRKIAESHQWGLRVWARESCPLARVTKLGNGPDRRYVVCDAWREKAVRQLIADPPSLVVTTGFSSRPTDVWDPARNAFTFGPRSLELEQQGFARELRRLRDAGVPVLLIGDNPSFAESAPKCALAHSTELARCSSAIANGLHGSVDLRAARSVRGVHLLDLTDRFCPAERCRQVLGSILAYRDDNHLTAEMVLSLRAPVEAAMRRAIQR